jgi:hypothetical protein
VAQDENQVKLFHVEAANEDPNSRDIHSFVQVSSSMDQTQLSWGDLDDSIIYNRETS